VRIKCLGSGTSAITVRRVDGQELDEPIHVDFGNSGTARVKKEEGRVLVDLYDSIVEVSTGDDGSDDQEDPS